MREAESKVMEKVMEVFWGVEGSLSAHDMVASMDNDPHLFEAVAEQECLGRNTGRAPLSLPSAVWRQRAQANAAM